MTFGGGIGIMNGFWGGVWGGFDVGLKNLFSSHHVYMLVSKVVGSYDDKPFCLLDDGENGLILVVDVSLLSSRFEEEEVYRREYCLKGFLPLKVLLCE